MKCYTIIPLSLFLVSFGFLHAEENKPPSAIPWYNQAMLERPFEFAVQHADTSLTGFHLYDFFSPRDPFVADKGNVGHAARSLRFNPPVTPRLNLFPAEPHLNYRFLHEKLRFYRPVHVFTDLFYVNGANREQLFHGLHSQRLHERIVSSMQYRIVNSPGALSRLGTRNSNVYLTFDYHTRDDRYQVLASFISNRFENHESGGLTDHRAFEQNRTSDQVIMTNAMSRYSETAIHINHFYRTGFYTPVRNNITREVDFGNGIDQDIDEFTKDSTEYDNGHQIDVSREEDLDDATERSFVNLGRINHNMSYVRRAFVLDEKTRPAAFYAVAPRNEAATLDSTMVQVFENQLSWSNFPVERNGVSFPFNFQLSLSHRLIFIDQPSFADLTAGESDKTLTGIERRTFSQFIPGITIETDRNRLFAFDAATRMTIGGYNDEDFEIGGNIYFRNPGSSGQLQASALFASREAPYFLSHYSGNYISWDRSFDKTNLFRISGKWSHRLIEAEGNYYIMNNMVFLNQEALPEQNLNTFSVFTAGISASPGIGILRSNHQVVFQYATDEQYERFPMLLSYHSVYADFLLFNKAMNALVGLDLTYNAPYKPMAFMPVVRQFYLQDEYDSGHVFLLDAFITAKVKRTRFFLRMQNLLDFLPGSMPVYMIPYYPQPGAALKLGISWMFFD